MSNRKKKTFNNITFSEYGELGQSKDHHNKDSDHKDHHYQTGATHSNTIKRQKPDLTKAREYMDRLRQDRIRNKEHYQRGYQTSPNNPTSSALVHILIFLTFAIITAYLLST